MTMKVFEIICEYKGDSNPLNLPWIDAWHKGQHLALVGNKDAIPVMRQAAKEAAAGGSEGESKYYLGTVAWLQKDYRTVQKYINDQDVQQTGSDKVLIRLMQNRSADYKDAY